MPSTGAEKVAAHLREDGSRFLDPLDFMHFSLLLKPEETDVMLRARSAGEKYVTPLLPNLLETASTHSDLLKAAKQIDCTGMQIKGYGCAGLSHTQSILLAMELYRTDGSYGTLFLVHSALAMQSIYVAGTAAQKEDWLPRMARLEAIGAFALTEPDFGSDAKSLQTTAQKVDGGWILNGRKRWVGNATWCDVTVVWARDTESKEIMGFLVERGTKGFVTTKMEHKMCLRITQNADITLKDCFVPDKMHLSGVKNFSEGTRKVLELSRAYVAAGATGLLLGAYERTVKYCLQRQQFGRRVASFQLVQERLMRALGLLQGCILTVLHVGRLLDQGKATMAQIALAKAWCTRSGREGIAICRESLGGNGIISDFGVIGPLLDIEALYTYEGTYDINMLLAGKLVLGHSAF